MKRLARQCLHRAAWCAVAVALMAGFALSAQQADAGSTRTPWQHLTQNQLTAIWWQWAWGIPVSDSPLVDETGANAYSGQPYSDLLFLAGTFTVTELQNGDVLGEATRSINVKQGTALFFPLLNGEVDNVCLAPHLGGNCFSSTPFPNVSGVPELRALAAAQQDTAEGLHATLTPTNAQFHPTGAIVTLSYARLQSPPFAYTVPATDNLYQSLYGIDVRGTVAPAVADGYYSFIPGTLLAPGYYTLEFGGTLPLAGGKKFTEALTYHITVTP